MNVYDDEVTCEGCIPWLKWIEAWIHIILYTEKCYPLTMFEKKRSWGFHIPTPTNSQVIEYVREVCESLQEGLCNGKLYNVILLIKPDGGDNRPEKKYYLKFGPPTFTGDGKPEEQAFNIKTAATKVCGPLIANEDTQRIFLKLITSIRDTPTEKIPEMHDENAPPLRPPNRSKWRVLAEFDDILPTYPAPPNGRIQNWLRIGESTFEGKEKENHVRIAGARRPDGRTIEITMEKLSTKGG